MEKDIFIKYKMSSRDEAVIFLKSLWNETPKPCPLCEGRLDFLHKKAKKSNSDWICTVCGERFDAIKILNQLNEG
ncbi:MAG: hypothetical protein IKY23_11830 [Lachnospiraceae bacterium]|nr:hypothetical protein [Lachnospiraceae bacterium]